MTTGKDHRLRAPRDGSPLTHCAGQGVQVSHGRALAVGAGNGKHLFPRPGLTQPAVDLSATVQAQFDRLGVTLLLAAVYFMLGVVIFQRKQMITR